MTATSRPWRRKRNGKAFGSWYVSHGGVTVNLQTKDAQLALKRHRDLRAGKWQPERAPDDDAPEIAEAQAAEAAAAAVDDALSSDAGAGSVAGADIPGGSGSTPLPATSDAPSPAPVESPPAPVTPSPEPAPPVASWPAEAQAAAAETATTETPDVVTPANVVTMSDAQLGALIVDLELRGLTYYVRKRCNPEFLPPELPPEAKALMVDSWTQVLSYVDLATMLPPWVLGLVVPSVTILVSTAMLADAWKVAALAQKAAAAPATPQAA